MKKINIILLLIISFYSCKAQNPIIDIEDYSYRNTVDNAYYKDINNYMNPFEGTWLYTNGIISFEIELVKEEMVEFGGFYSDYMRGGYHYTDGIVDVNTLDNTEMNIATLGIDGSSIIDYDETRPPCINCNIVAKRLDLSISDLERKLYGDFTLSLTTVNGESAIEGYIRGIGEISYDVEDPPPYFEMQIPSGYYVFIKQP